ncbi:hypothetical protein AB1Y20_019146 [Prymnesium parvum]|uniref:Uncharacterized protein n=1 Tax=Prymnesium parvum TaxID=97485 RepID=A0AB34JQL5_PRYPA
MLSLLAVTAAPMGAATAPSGTYHGVKSILGETIDTSVKVDSATSMDLAIKGVISIACAAEAYKYDGSSVITLPGMNTPGDCVHDALAQQSEVSIKSIEYDSTADSIKINAEFAILSVSITLTKEGTLRSPETAEDRDRMFEEFTRYHRRTYVDSERALRRAIFEENLNLITQRNSDGDLGRHWVNKFSDVSEEEFRATHLGYKPKANASDAQPELELPLTVSSAASSIDWRSHSPSVLTPVKDQGQCGSCWAFSATEQIETDVAMSTGKLYTLAPQQIVSCDHTDMGCNGGNTETAYKYVAKEGLEAESSYPYKSGNTGSSGQCKYSKSKSVVTIQSYKTVSRFGVSEGKMLTQIQKSPISVCVDASKWQTYRSGIMGKSCGTSLDHCVQAVGYNANEGYWIVRNSWNTDWGVDGYIYVKEGVDACGIAKDATIVEGASVQLSVESA